MKLLSLLFLFIAAIALGAPSFSTSATSSVESHRSGQPETTSALLHPGVTAEGGIPSNLYSVSISFSEYCESGELHARGWIGGWKPLDFFADVTRKIPIKLHSDKYLLLGPYSYDQQAFGLEYNGCVWTSEGGWPCGWCEVQPWVGELPDCAAGGSGQRVSYRTCYFIDQNMPGIERRGVEAGNLKGAARAVVRIVSGEQPSQTDTSTSDLNIASEDTEDDLEPDFTVNIFEYCDGARLAIRAAQFRGIETYDVMVATNSSTLVHMHTPTPYEDASLVLGPYSFSEHSLNVESNGCKWNSGDDRASSCGWCQTEPWTAGPLECESDTAFSQRFISMKCYSPGSPDDHTSETVTSILAPPTITPQPILPDSSDILTPISTNGPNVEASTVTLMPAILETTLPATPPNHLSIILPFHIQTWEYCGPQGKFLAAGVYVNGNMRSSLEFQPGTVVHVNHQVPGYKVLDVGPVDFGQGRLRFSYNGCEWWDTETWKSCGECRAGVWSAGPIDCDGSTKVRVKDMDCSVLLGVRKKVKMGEMKGVQVV